MNTFEYEIDGYTLYIASISRGLYIGIAGKIQGFGIVLDQEGRDALRNYLDDLEMEE